ncbi:MAG: hypothetical protein LBE38_03420 [Deltaproteobacteria bacterium]|jgi:hypothetical protein|nr:hypothetical protein [Deltaproteobacteria bacterium]
MADNNKPSIHCPNCNENVTLPNESCPKCGYNFRTGQKPKSGPSPQPGIEALAATTAPKDHGAADEIHDRKKAYWLAGGAGLVILIIVLAIIFSGGSDKKNLDPTPAVSQGSLMNAQQHIGEAHEAADLANERVSQMERHYNAEDGAEPEEATN